MANDPVDEGRRAAVRIAEEILARHGSDVRTAAPGTGWSNATWLTDDVVIRVARTAGPADLLRETRLAALLPAQVGYPEIVDAGVLHGHEWVLTRRIPARNLEDVWPGLGWEKRAEAIGQVWAKADQVHQIDVAEAAPFVRSRSPFFAESAAEAEASLHRLAAADLLTGRQVQNLGEAMDRFWAALPGTPKVLNHGDLGACNVLWSDGCVRTLLDFEFAVIGPVEIDLNEIVKFAYGPPGGTDVPSGNAGRKLAQDAVTMIAERALADSGGADVLLGYSVMLEAWLTEAELTAADSAGGPDAWEPYRLLTALADADGGHLAPLLAAL